MCFTSNVVKSSAVILQIHVPSPFPTQYNVERSKELHLDGFNTVRGVGVGRCSVSSGQSTISHLLKSVRTVQPSMIVVLVVHLFHVVLVVTMTATRPMRTTEVWELQSYRNLRTSILFVSSILYSISVMSVVMFLHRGKAKPSNNWNQFSFPKVAQKTGIPL